MPAFVIVCAVAWLYEDILTSGVIADVRRWVVPVVAAIVLDALWSLRTTAVRDWRDVVVVVAADPNVDIVYVATPNSRHRDDTEMYLRAGKHVLCEKPFALNEIEAKSMIAAARNEGRFVMEAIWSRFLPVYVALGEVLSSHPLGKITHVEADFGFDAPTERQHRLNDPALGGGAVLDLGIYCLHFARFVLGGHDSV
ncbi:MAG: Gfo/Idh/MocA family oxidoreductase, partial [Actinomycetota bacterium]